VIPVLRKFTKTQIAKELLKLLLIVNVDTVHMESSSLNKTMRTLQLELLLTLMVLLQVYMVSLSTLLVISQTDVKPPVVFTTHTAVSTVVHKIAEERLVIWVTSMLIAAVMLNTLQKIQPSHFGVKPMSWEEPSLLRKVKTTLDMETAHVPRSMDVLVNVLDMVFLVHAMSDYSHLNLTNNYYSCGLEKNHLLIIIVIKSFLIYNLFSKFIYYEWLF
jgi:hypothetical protein